MKYAEIKDQYQEISQNMSIDTQLNQQGWPSVLLKVLNIFNKENLSPLSVFVLDKTPHETGLDNISEVEFILKRIVVDIEYPKH